MFTLILESGAHVRGVVIGDSVDLPALSELRSQDVVVAGVAKFRLSGSVLRIEGERIERAHARDLSLWTGPNPGQSSTFWTSESFDSRKDPGRGSTRSSVGSLTLRVTTTSSRHSIG